MKTHNHLLLELAKCVVDSAKTLGAQLTTEAAYSAIVEPPQFEMGHFAFGCFRLAKDMKKAPPMIATELAAHIKTDDVVEKVQAAGPYLNFIINPKAYGDLVIKSILDESFFGRDILSEKPKTMIEYSQPNTHKVLHVGHMRNLCLGNALIKMGRSIDADIISVTYPGDVGTHVAKCLWYLKNHYTRAWPEGSAEAKGAWLGSIYTLATHKLDDELGSDKEDENRKQLTAILKQLEAGSGEYYDLWRETRQWSLKLMEKAYAWAGVKFDRWFFESEVDAPSLKFVHELFEQGKLVKDQGAIGMDLSDDKLGFCLLVKSDGNGLYATKDVQLAKVKFEEFKVKKSVYIVDNRQAHHFKQVFKVLEKIGFEQAKDCFHLAYDVVELPDGAMSSRKGNIVPLMDLVEQMEARITTDYLEKYRGQWSDDEIKETAHAVAGGAIIYGMVRVDNNRKIVFDMDEWLKLDGETGPYLQYANARIRSLVEKLGPVSSAANFECLKNNSELALASKLSRYNDVIEKGWSDLKTIGLCSYLYELAKLFNSFYVECPIAKADSEELKQARLALAAATGKTLERGLNALGISAPARM
ncbi:MAG: arginine--tRNA ligase [Halobacteriovorax sp.]|nr:arginine--tRNA ligase [Halobacteriovorax sp.]